MSSLQKVRPGLISSENMIKRACTTIRRCEMGFGGRTCLDPVEVYNSRVIQAVRLTARKWLHRRQVSNSVCKPWR